MPAEVDQALTGSMARRTVRAVAWSYTSWAGSKMVVLVTTAVLAHLLTPDDFGVFGFAFVVVAYLSVLQDFGLGSALIHRRDDVEDAADTVFTMSLLISSGLALLGIVTAPWVAGYFDEPQITPILRILSLGFVISALGSTHIVLLQRELQFARKMVPDLGGALVRAAAAIAVAMLGGGAWALVAGHMAGVVTSTILAWTVLPWRPRVRLAQGLLRPLTRFGSPLVGVDAVHAAVGNLDYLVVGKVLGSSALGLYTVAYRLPELLMLGVVTVLSKAAFPALAAMQDRPAAMRRGFLASVRYVAIAVIPVGLGIALAADPIVRVVLGDRWLDAIPVLRLLGLFALVSSLLVTDGDVYKAVGRPGLLMRFALLKIVLFVPALLVGVQYGLVGVAVAHLATTIVVKLARVLVAVRLLDVTIGALAARLTPALLAGGAMVTTVLPALALSAGATPLTRLAVAVAVGAATYIPLIGWMERSAIGELAALFRRERGSVPR